MSTRIRVGTCDGSAVEVTAVTDMPLTPAQHRALLARVTELSGYLRDLELATMKLDSKGGTE